MNEKRDTRYWRGIFRQIAKDVTNSNWEEVCQLVYELASSALEGGLKVPEETRDDLVQEVLSELHQGDLTAVSDPVAYVRKRLYWRFVDIHRSDRDRRIREKKYSERNPRSREGRPETLAAQQELARMVRRAVNSMPKKEAELLTWFYLDEMSLAEIAERRGVSVAAAAKRVQRAMKKFKARYSENFVT